MNLPSMRNIGGDPLNQLVKDYLNGKENLIGIQIGSYRGESAQIFLNSNAFIKFYCIDSWIKGYDPADGTSNAPFKEIEEDFDNRFKNNKIIIKIKNMSSKVFNMFEDNSIDFIYIDGCHRYQNVKEDLINYVPKIKIGGLICGHDYGGGGHIAGVKKAVDEFFNTPPIKTYSDRSWVHIKK